MKYKGLLIDLDDTLYDYHLVHECALESTLSMANQELEFDKEIVKGAFREARHETHVKLKNTASSHGRILYFQKMLEILGKKAVPFAYKLNQNYWQVFLKGLRPHQGVLDFFQSLGAIKKCILTDFTAEKQYEKLMQLKLCDYIDFMVTSEEVGIEKPDESIFFQALDKMKLGPEDVCMIGDNFINDMEGALNIGIDAFWFNRKALSFEKRKKLKSFSTFAELSRLIQDE